MIKVIQRPSIILRDLVIDYEGDTNDDDIKYYVEQIGKYPYLQIGDTVIEINNMIQTILYNNQFLPKIEVQFRDPTNRLFDVLFPVDNEILSLFIQSNSEILMPIRMDFKILDFNIIKNKENEKNDLIYSIVGILNVNNLYFNSFSSYPNTSFEVLKKIATDSELGFATNIDNTNDGMIWINTGNTNLKFIQNVVSHSYLNDSTFMYAYIDFYYNLNYVDIESALNEDISDQTGILFSSNLTTNLNNDSEETEMDLILTNHPDKLNSNNYINKFNIINSSTRVNLDIGYKSILIYNDKNDNVIYKLLMDTITTTGKNNDQVVLKGKVGEISELMENSIDYMNLGKIDTDNVHSNYLYAKQQNIKNLNALQKIKVKVVINLMNFNLYRFQKIQLKFYKMDDISITDDKPIKPTPEKVENYNGENYDENRINKRLSGEWLITAINYTFNKISGFSQEVTLVKRELGFNDDDFNN
ncbi:hypothetical protein [Trichloromonas sp.]|uniref:hypothetical protein n=1 Tax=Trichloromonas sp. TaxID=3069249 RepID=UPI002A486D06|nr:hypothetical protein [Trichloromonas sp.]